MPKRKPRHPMHCITRTDCSRAHGYMVRTYRKGSHVPHVYRFFNAERFGWRRALKLAKQCRDRALAGKPVARRATRRQLAQALDAARAARWA